MENKMRLEFTNEYCNELFARMTETAFAALLDPTVEELAEIKTAISEAVTNAIIHGYAKKTGIVVMEGEIHEHTIIYTIRDYGCGIENVAKAREPLYTGKPELERSGMGFSIMECFMDRVDVESQLGVGTTVRLTKELRV